jgi:hypothetical protein
LQAADFCSPTKTDLIEVPLALSGASFMNQTNGSQLRKNQAPLAFHSLQAALTDHVEDVNRRLHANLELRQTQAGFEVHELEKTAALLRVSLTLENNIHYTQFVKRRNEMQSGVIYVRASQQGNPSLWFSDFPSPNVELSYEEASKRLLNSAF